MKQILILMAVVLSGCAFSQHFLKQTSASVVKIHGRTMEGGYVATAFAIENHGKFSHLLTNRHACDGELSLDDGTPLAVLRVDDEADLCLVYAPKSFEPLPLASSNAEYGTEVVVVGFPLGVSSIITRGYVGLAVDDGQMLSAIISPGSSGSPVLNQAGKVVGIVFAGYLRGQQVNLMVPVSEIKRFVNERN